MIAQSSAPWLVAGSALHSISALACLFALVWIAQRGDAARSDRIATMVALGITAIWSMIHSAFGPIAPGTLILEIIRNLAWIFVLYRMFANDGRDRNLGPIRPVVFSLAFLEILQIALVVIALRFAITDQLALLTFQIASLFRVLLAVGALVLLHNLYAGASTSSRRTLRWSAAALAGMWAYELNVHTVNYLGDMASVELTAIRAGIFVIMSALLAIGATASATQMRFQPSRAVTFQTLSLMVIGGYLLLMVAVAQSLSMMGGGAGRLSQIGFVLVASVVALMWLPSQRLRGWLRVTAAKHLFQHRYDYRAEWLRFTGTIGRVDGDAPPLQERAVQAIADITDSPSGLLLAPDEKGDMELVARWNWPGVEVPSTALSTKLSKLIEAGDFIVDIDDVRSGHDRHGEAALLPDWLQRSSRAWALVPLLHFDRLVGIVVLARPADARRLDWEDFDLLKIGGRQLASYLAEQSGQQALMEASRFDEFNRRIAFVMHDIKNLASQISLLSSNAEKHADNPEFRADMLVTLRNSSDKLNALLARLGRYGSGSGEGREPVDLSGFLHRLVSGYDAMHPVAITECEPCTVTIDRHALEQAISHLIQNGIDASGPDTPVCLQLTTDGVHARIEILDSGAGMSPQFIRNGLFKPFVSSKQGGFGIGAMEARELVRAMNGWLEVESREGLGTRFVIRLPLSAAAAYLQPSSAARGRQFNEVA